MKSSTIKHEIARELGSIRLALALTGAVIFTVGALFLFWLISAVPHLPPVDSSGLLLLFFIIGAFLLSGSGSSSESGEFCDGGLEDCSSEGYDGYSDAGLGY
jgi:hypothetical protein